MHANHAAVLVLHVLSATLGIGEAGAQGDLGGQVSKGCCFLQVPASFAVEVERAVTNAAGHGMLSWFRCLNGALQIWVLPKAYFVSLGRSFNPDILHGVAKCMLFILASDFQSAEHFQLQLLLVGCEPRKSHAELGAVKPAVSDWAWQDLTALSGSLLMVRLRILDLIPSPGKLAALVGANHSAHLPASHPCSSSVFSYPVSLPG